MIRFAIEKLGLDLLSFSNSPSPLQLNQGIPQGPIRLPESHPDFEIIPTPAV
jgi:hypothetical protein